MKLVFEEYFNNLDNWNFEEKTNDRRVYYG